ncbi:MAG: HNH endonuclease [Caldilineaceae bacterium]|nr:HNH endonuclease [Caldilineaceae bacterium]
MTIDALRRAQTPAPLVATLNDTFPSPCPIVQQVRQEYAHWRYDLSDGYILYFLTGFGQEYEQRLVAERAFGPIPPDHIVRRHNSDRTDNRAANLYLLRRSDHGLFTLEREPALTYTCAHCGQTFKAPRQRIERTPSGQLFCSRACKDVMHRKVTRPSADELHRLMLDIGNWTALGQQFGVSDNAVRKWARRYGLDLSICDGRRKNEPHGATA